MPRWDLVSAVMLLAPIAGTGLLSCDHPSESSLREDILSLRGEVQQANQLRHDLESLRKDVEELRTALEAQTGQPPGGTLLGAHARTSSAVTPSVLRLDQSHRDDPFLGDEYAPILIMAFIDYESPAARHFASQVLPKIKEHFVHPRRVQLIFRDFPLANHPHATQAAVFAHCAGEQGTYFSAFELLFANPEMVEQGDFTNLAEKLRPLNKRKFMRCLGNTKYTQELREDVEAGLQLGVKGVPSFFIGRRMPMGDTPTSTLKGVFIRGAQPYSVFEAEINRLLEAESASPPPA